MAQRCEITGKKPLTGYLVSHSMRHTKHRQMPNLQTKRIWVPEEGRFIKMKVSARALKAMTRNGVSATIAKAKRKGMM
ncbi:MAG: 50S ribosomal protein L28 [Armatimonadetes bacterium]|nr:50S ribosomal protein L28 [Armatimonadota bacterium]